MWFSRFETLSEIVVRRADGRRPVVGRERLRGRDVEGEERRADAEVPRDDGLARCGLGLKRPNGVATAPGWPTSASDGRSVNTESKLVSFPDVMLNGSADVQLTNGIDGVIVRQLDRPAKRHPMRGTGAAPHSAARLAESAGTL